MLLLGKKHRGLCKGGEGCLLFDPGRLDLRNAAVWVRYLMMLNKIVGTRHSKPVRCNWHRGLVRSRGLQIFFVLNSLWAPWLGQEAIWKGHMDSRRSCGCRRRDGVFRRGGGRGWGGA